MPQVSAAVLRSTPSSTRASASIRRAAALFFSPLAALRSSEAVRSSRVTDTAAPIDAAPLQKPASSQSFTDLGIPNESQFRAVGIRLFNSVVAWRQQIGAGTWPPGLRLIVFVKTRRHSSFWRAIYWQIQSMLASDLNLPRISWRIFRSPKGKSSPLAKAKYFLNCATKAVGTLR